MSMKAVTAMTVLMSMGEKKSEPKLSPAEKSVIVRALNEDIDGERKHLDTPGLAGYAQRNIEFREALIAKIEAL